MDDNKKPAEVVKAAKAVISIEEAERRRAHVRGAIANSRIEGIPPNPEVDEICAAYIRGEIEAGDLVNAYKEGRFRQGP